MKELKGNDSISRYQFKKAEESNIIDQKFVEIGVDPRKPRLKGQTWKDAIEDWPRPFKYTLAPMYELKSNVFAF